MYKCKICGKKYTELSGLYSHIEKKHAEAIPMDMSVQQFYYFMKTGRQNGNCVMCKKPTTWNKNTNKYNRFCGDPACKAEYVRIAKSRMIAKYGKVHLLNDPNKQREMLANRKISGKYRWSDSNIETIYTGSYELDFLKTLDNFFEWDPIDISMPSPHTYTYMYEGEQKFYIPDVFIHSLDLEIEIKDGGDNPNNHYKIQAIDKEKERLKDEVMTSQKMFHYIKITNKNYTNLFEFLKEVKDGFEKYGDEKKIPRIFKIEDIKTKAHLKSINESTEIDEELEYLTDAVEEGFISDLVKDFQGKSVLQNKFIVDQTYNVKKESPEKLKEYLSKIIKASKTENDLKYVKELVGKSDTYYHNLMRKKPELQEEYYGYMKWVDSELPKEIKKKMKKIKESTIVYESSISMSQLNKYLQNEYDKELKKYLNDYTTFYHRMLKEKPDMVPHLNEDIKRAIIFIDGLANKGVSNDLLQTAKHELGDLVELNKHTKVIKQSKFTQKLVESDTVELDDSYEDSIESLVVDIKVVSESTRPFTLTDLDSKVEINGRYAMNREKVGTLCSIKPSRCVYENRNVSSYQVKFLSPVNVDDSIKDKLTNGVRINSLFNINDLDNKFINEVCLRLFGSYPESCTLKE